MTSYTIAWGFNDAEPSGQNTTVVTNIKEVDVVLDRLASESAEIDTPRMLDIYEGSWSQGQTIPPSGMQFVWGHSDRASLTWLGPGPGYGEDPALPEWPEPIAYDQDEIGPHRTRLTPDEVRQAVREYVSTCQRPESVSWVTD